MTTRRALLIAPLALPAFVRGAAAQDAWPNRAVTVLVPFVAGGPFSAGGAELEAIITVGLLPRVFPDAAGLAEEKFGAGRDNTGVIVLLTFGTGIGSAVIHNGVLLPNTEFGHLEVGGKEAEHRAASSVKDRKEWSYERWTQEVSRVLVAIENAIWPDLFIAGGGISRKADKWIPLLTNRTPVVGAALQNTAGIVGAAMAARGDGTS